MNRPNHSTPGSTVDIEHAGYVNAGPDHHEVWDLHSNSRYAIASGKMGPAFSPVSDVLAKSLQAQALKAAGECIQAIHRNQRLDYLPAWRRLCRVMGVTFPVGLTPWVFEGVGMSELVACAMANVESIDASHHWQIAERAMRSVAARRVGVLRELIAKADEGDDSHVQEMAQMLTFAYPDDVPAAITVKEIA